jgi:ABC-type sugar transport system substrate-binding protein
MRIGKTIFIVFAFMAIGAFAAFAGGAKEQGSTTGSKAAMKTLTIGVVPKSLGQPYWNACEEGSKKAAQDFNVNVIFTAPTAEDINKQVSTIEDLITKKVDALVISAVDSKAIAPVIHEAFAAGIPVFTFDIDSPDSGRLWCTTAGDPEQTGKQMAEGMAKEIGYSGKVALLTGGLGSDALNRRLRSMETTLKQWQNIQVVGTEACEDDFQKGVSQVENLLQTYPDLKGLGGVSTVNPPSAATAVVAAGLGGKVAIWGLGLPKQNAEFVKSGVISGLMLWDPRQMAYIAVKTAIDYVNTKKLPTDGEDFGWGGKILVKTGEKISYVPSLIFNKDNVDLFGF